MKPAPLQLTDYYLTSFSFEANPDFDPDTPLAFDFETLQVTPEVRLTDDLGDDGTKWLVTLLISQTIPENQNTPYSFNLQIQGLVLVSPHLTGNTLERAIQANGPALLFGAAREIIRAATGRGPWAPVIIPSTNFLTDLPPALSPKKKKVLKQSKKVTKKTVSKKTAKQK